MDHDDTFLTDPMTVPGQLDLLGDECSPVGLARVNVPLDDTHSESLIQTRIIRSEFQQLRLEASRWTPGGPQ